MNSTNTYSYTANPNLASTAFPRLQGEVSELAPGIWAINFAGPSTRAAQSSLPAEQDLSQNADIVLSQLEDEQLDVLANLINDDLSESAGN